LVDQLDPATAATTTSYFFICRSWPDRTASEQATNLASSVGYQDRAFRGRQRSTPLRTMAAGASENRRQRPSDTTADLRKRTVGRFASARRAVDLLTDF
jgi:hypothetical protein